MLSHVAPTAQLGVKKGQRIETLDSTADQPRDVAHHAPALRASLRLARAAVARPAQDGGQADRAVRLADGFARRPSGPLSSHLTRGRERTEADDPGRLDELPRTGGVG
jgi:hypothetical protein